MAHTILVAEDQYIDGVDICDTCEEAGYMVEGPYTGISSAMLALQKERPDLAILDYQLGEGPLFALAQKLAEENVPIIFHSGSAMPPGMAERFPHAATLPKPCPPAQFIDAIHRMLAAT
ncbi:MAG: response regulator [Erythrobacter sp.]